MRRFDAEPVDAGTALVAGGDDHVVALADHADHADHEAGSVAFVGIHGDDDVALVGDGRRLAQAVADGGAESLVLFVADE